MLWCFSWPYQLTMGLKPCVTDQLLPKKCLFQPSPNLEKHHHFLESTICIDKFYSKQYIFKKIGLFQIIALVKRQADYKTCLRFLSILGKEDLKQSSRQSIVLQV